MRTKSSQLNNVQNRSPEANRVEVVSYATRGKVDEIVPVLNVNSFAYRYGKPINLVNKRPRNTWKFG
jgi:hypothetical protein